jgi:Ca2+-transporting ATPase
VCSMVFEAEAEEANIMRRSPRAAGTPLLSLPLVTWGLVQGTTAFAFLASLYAIAVHSGLPDGDVRALTFVSLVLVDLGLVLVNRNFSASLRDLMGQRNRALIWISGVAVALLGLVVGTPLGRELFRFGPLHADDISLVAFLVIATVATLEAAKRLWRERLGR